MKNIKRSIMALAIAAAVLAAGAMLPFHGNASGQEIAFFLPDIIECT